jgi:hypothetical protein
MRRAGIILKEPKGSGEKRVRGLVANVVGLSMGGT